MRRFKHNAKNKRKLFGFTLVELLIVISIISILATLVTVTVRPIQQKSRDARRKADTNLMISGLNLFYSDFKVYPASTFYLGSYNNSGKAANTNLALAGDIISCNGAPIGATANFTNPQQTNPTANDLDTNAISLKPGFVSVNNFLICLKYMDRVLADPTPTRAYHYRVSYDYGSILVGAELENQRDGEGVNSLFADGATYANKWYFEGNGKTIRHLDDDSDTTDFYAGVTGTPTDGSYFYQCYRDGTGAIIDEDKRPDFPPLIYNGTAWVANSGSTATTCQGSPTTSDVARPGN